MRSVDALGCVMVLLTLAVSGLAGWLAWKWIEPEGFFGFVAFILIWGLISYVLYIIVGGILSCFIKD